MPGEISKKDIAIKENHFQVLRQKKGHL